LFGKFFLGAGLSGWGEDTEHDESPPSSTSSRSATLGTPGSRKPAYCLDKVDLFARRSKYWVTDGQGGDLGGVRF
jgi:hypothetical protein